MIRLSEFVLPGHPDKFCDAVADAVIALCYRADPEAYGQVEVAVWSDQVWLSGGICTRRPLARSLRQIVVDTGLAIGYVPGNHIDATRYQVGSTVCQRVEDPRPWSQQCNDQAIVIGWAGYDAKTGYLPPEHFLARAFGQALARACRGGVLAGQGPDGKLLVRMREEGRRWTLEHVLVTLQSRAGADFLVVCGGIAATLQESYLRLQAADGRWVAPWDEVELLLNPNGPLVCAGSDGDNGQTGRKLVMDYYGPRVPIGGGALAGKHLTHIDRLGAIMARRAALETVRSGAQSCTIRLAYAPNCDQPLELACEIEGRGRPPSRKDFGFRAMAQALMQATGNPAAAMEDRFRQIAAGWNACGAGGNCEPRTHAVSGSTDVPP